MMHSNMDNTFPKGIFFNPRTPNMPDFVKGKISIKAEDAIPWIKANANEKGYVNIDLLKSKEGKLYLKVNSFVPNAQN